MRNIRKMVKEVEANGNAQKSKSTPRRALSKVKSEDDDSLIKTEYDLTTPPPLTPTSDPDTKGKFSNILNETPMTPTPNRKAALPMTPDSIAKKGAVLGGRVVKRSLRARKTLDYAAFLRDDDEDFEPTGERDTSKHATVESEDSADSDENYVLDVDEL
jgi:hypothetical protein